MAKMQNTSKKKNTKKGKQGGFTLIELLAVITIMGILMMVAIPAISRTIENTRRDTFKNTAQNYVGAIKNEVSSDALECNVGGGWQYISAVPDKVNPTTNYVYVYTFDSNTDSGKDLMESGGKSSWGNAHVKGNVSIIKQVVSLGGGTNTTVKYTYSVRMVDSAGRGIKENINLDDLRRGSVATAGTAADYNGATTSSVPGTKIQCRLAS